MTTRLDAAEANLDRLLEWISRVDNKAAFALITATTMLGTLVSFAPDEISTKVRYTAYATGTLLLMSSACIMLVAFPRTRDAEVGARKPSLFFFGTTAGLKLDDYRARFEQLTDEEILDDLLGQCHVNSRILDAKFRFLRWSYGFLYAAAPLWTICLLKFLAA